MAPLLVITPPQSSCTGGPLSHPPPPLVIVHHRSLVTMAPIFSHHGTWLEPLVLVLISTHTCAARTGTHAPRAFWHTDAPTHESLTCAPMHSHYQEVRESLTCAPMHSHHQEVRESGPPPPNFKFKIHSKSIYTLSGGFCARHPVQVFFDNERENVRDCSPLGIQCVYTPDGESWAHGTRPLGCMGTLCVHTTLDGEPWHPCGGLRP